MKAFLAAQLDDPTRMLHALGVLIIAGEVIRHWVSGKPVDVGTIGAGVGCFSVGGVLDHFNGPKNGSP